MISSPYSLYSPYEVCDCRFGDPMGHYLPQCPHPGQKIKFTGTIE